jgi:hypothetical protein
LTESPE